ncbi:MAG: hypothetical protein JOY89_27780 [Solirubrobacterales bacterium]|nr:hypothetical protein [Solirubrobacterales bacterium]
MSQTTLNKYSRVGLWALPIYGLANLVGTLSSQPDYHKAANFPAYARYIHTPSFLASHLGLSLLGTGIGLLGFTALFVYLTIRGSGVSVVAFVSTIIGSVFMAAVFGVAAFAQPAIGKAFLAGHHDAIALNSSVYGTALNLTVAGSLLLYFAGAVLFAIAISRSRALPRTAGILFAASFPVFAIGSITGTVLASVAALVQIASAIWIARSVSSTTDTHRTTAVIVDQEPPALVATDA